MIDAFHIAAVGTREEVARALWQHGPRSAAGRLLDAVLAQYDGDVDGAIRRLRSVVAEGGPDAACAADMLAPTLVMRRGHEPEIAALAELLGKNGWRASEAAFRALLAVREPSRSQALTHFDRAMR